MAGHHSPTRLNAGVRIVKLLLEQEEVNPGSQDDYGRTPFTWAARPGRNGQGIVKLLLGRGGVNPESQDTPGRPSPPDGAEYESEGIAKPSLEGNEGLSLDKSVRENVRHLSEQILDRSVRDNMRHLSEQIHKHTTLKPPLLSFYPCAFLFFLFVYVPVYPLKLLVEAAFLFFLFVYFFPCLNPLIFFFLFIYFFPHLDPLMLVVRSLNWLLCVMGPSGCIGYRYFDDFFQCCGKCHFIWLERDRWYKEYKARG